MRFLQTSASLLWFSELRSGRQRVRAASRCVANKRLHLTARGFGLASAAAGGWVGALRRRCGFAAGRRAV